MEQLSRRELSYLIFVSAVFFVLRCFQLGEQGFWLDEMTSLEIAKRSLGDILSGVGFDRHTPPAYYLLLHEWLQLVPNNEWGVRLFSALFDAANISLIFLLFRKRCGLELARVVTLLYGTSAFAIYYAQEARMYSLLLFLVLLTHLLAERLRREQVSWIVRVAAILTATIGLYTHYYYCLALLGLSLAIGIEERFNSRFLMRWTTTFGISLICLLPWVQVILSLAGSGGQHFRQHTSWVLPYAGWRFLAGYGVLPLTVGAKNDLLNFVWQGRWIVGSLLGISGLVIIQGLRSLRSSNRIQRNWLAINALFVPLIAAIVSLKIPMLSERYLIVIYPFVLAVIAQGLIALNRSQTGSWGSGIFAALWLFTLSQHFFNTDFGKAQWKESAEFIQRSSASVKTVLVEPVFCRSLLGYYLNPTYRLLSVTKADSHSIDGELERELKSNGIWLVESADSVSLISKLQELGGKVEQEQLFPHENGIRVVLFRSNNVS